MRISICRFSLNCLAICMILFSTYLSSIQAAFPQLKRKSKAKIARRGKGSVQMKGSSISEHVPLRLYDKVLKNLDLSITKELEALNPPKDVILPEKRDSNLFEGLMEKGDYVEIAMLGDEMGTDKFVKYVCPLMTTLAHYKNLYAYLKRRNIMSGFLVHASMKLVKEVINGFKQGTEYPIYDTSIFMAFLSSFKHGHHFRVVGLLEATQERFAEGDKQLKLKGSVPKFERFMHDFFAFDPEKDTESVKYFISLYGEEFSTKYPAIFMDLCEKFACRRYSTFDDPEAAKLSVDLLGQPFPLTPPFGPLAFVPTGFKTKQQLEDEWMKKNAPKFLAKLEQLFIMPFVPTVLLKLIAEYGVTWIVV